MGVFLAVEEDAGGIAGLGIVTVLEVTDVVNAWLCGVKLRKGRRKEGRDLLQLFGAHNCHAIRWRHTPPATRTA
jgi:hypothetical protein